MTIAVSASGLRKAYGKKVALRLRDLGVSQRALQMERDGWILLQAVSPKRAATWIKDKIDTSEDPEFRAIYLEYDAAFDRSPDDPRLYALSDRAAHWIATRRGRSNGRQAIQDPAIARFVAMSVEASSPAWDRLLDIANSTRRAGEGAVISVLAVQTGVQPAISTTRPNRRDLCGDGANRDGIRHDGRVLADAD